MDKYNLKNVTFLIPYSYDSIDRLENIKLAIDYLRYNFDTNIIVFEFSDTETLKEDGFNLDCVLYKYIKKDNEYIHRTKMLNDMMKISNTDIIVNYDVDVLLELDDIKEAYSLINENKMDVVLPYKGRCLEISRNLITKIRETFNISTLDMSLTNCINPLSVGGALFINKRKYIEIGAENEKFIGWGFEDNERINRIEKMGLRHTRTNGVLIHIEHWRGINSVHHHKFISNNESEFNKVARMSKDQLKKYIKTWSWIKNKG